uniref:Uncharacterized protein n=1 Tax=Tanacetum cinerariifolium TaxID=118510 RepID=A0A699GQU9_TANCI|nr:hypothetical protein [Tanacetum cinerariifolium]
MISEAELQDCCFKADMDPCVAYSARSCDRVILPLTILSDSRVTTSCCSNDPTLARRVSMQSPTDSICSGAGGTAIGGGDGDTHDGDNDEGNLDLLRDKDGKSYGGGEDDDVKSNGGGDNDGISDGSSG